MKGKLSFSHTQGLVARFSDVAYTNTEGKTPFGVFCYATVTLSSSEGKKKCARKCTVRAKLCFANLKILLFCRSRCRCLRRSILGMVKLVILPLGKSLLLTGKKRFLCDRFSYFDLLIRQGGVSLMRS